MKELGLLLKTMEQAADDKKADASKDVRKEIAAYAEGEKPEPKDVRVQKEAAGTGEPEKFTVHLLGDRTVEKVGDVVKGVFTVVKEFRIIHK